MAIGLATLVLVPSAHVGYDAMYELASAQEIWAGQTPGYALPVPSPTPHPLVTLVALVTVAGGSGAPAIFVSISLLVYGALCYGVQRVGRRLAGWPAGVLAAVLVFASAPITQLAARTYVDVWSACALVWATAIEVHRPRRGWPVTALLVTAGLMRPEAWVLAGVYWLYLFRGRDWRGRIGLGALTAAGPVLWVVHDWLLTGDLLHAQNQNTDAAERLASTLDVAQLWPAVPAAIVALVSPAIVVGAVAGAVLGWRHRRRATVVVIAAALLSGCTTILLGLGGLVFLPRFLLFPAIALNVMFAVGVTGWLGLARGRERWAWASVAAALVVVLVVLAPGRLEEARRFAVAQRGYARTIDSLEAFARTDRVRAAFETCRRAYVPHFVYRPYLRYFLESAPLEVPYTFPDRPRGLGRSVVIVPSRHSHVALRRLRWAASHRRMSAAGFRRLAANADWTMYAPESCAGAQRRTTP